MQFVFQLVGVEGRGEQWTVDQVDTVDLVDRWTGGRSGHAGGAWWGLGGWLLASTARAIVSRWRRATASHCPVRPTGCSNVRSAPAQNVFLGSSWHISCVTCQGHPGLCEKTANFSTPHEPGARTCAVGHGPQRLGKPDGGTSIKVETRSGGVSVRSDARSQP